MFDFVRYTDTYIYGQVLYQISFLVFLTTSFSGWVALLLSSSRSIFKQSNAVPQFLIHLRHHEHRQKIISTYLLMTVFVISNACNGIHNWFDYNTVILLNTLTEVVTNCIVRDVMPVYIADKSGSSYHIRNILAKLLFHHSMKIFKSKCL